MTALSQEELRGVQLSILDALDAFCRDHNITYHLAFGTLLGACRYGGYIPWDDDVDLSMSRDDYSRFCRLFPEDHRQFTLGAPGITDGWAFPFAKLCDKRTVLVEETELEHHLGVNVDIFPVDHEPANLRHRVLRRRRVQTLKGLLALKSLTPREGRSRPKAAVLRATKLIVRRIPDGTLPRMIDRAATSHRGGQWVSIVVGPYVWDVHESAMASSVPLPFEGRDAPAPVGFHEVLSAIYGANYLEPPPEARRVTHHGFAARWAE